MKIDALRKLLWLAPAAMILVLQTPPSLRAQAAPYNIDKEILDHKDTLNWKSVNNGIPSDVCAILQVCNGATKVVAMPRATEGGQPIVRGVFLTQDSKNASALVLERQTPADVYFFLLTPQGTLAKAVYAQVGSKSWIPMGMALAQPTFDKDKLVWHNWAAKLGTGPSAGPATGPAADKKPES